MAHKLFSLNRHRGFDVNGDGDMTRKKKTVSQSQRSDREQGTVCKRDNCGSSLMVFVMKFYIQVTMLIIIGIVFDNLFAK